MGRTQSHRLDAEETRLLIEALREAATIADGDASRAYPAFYREACIARRDRLSALEKRIAFERRDG